MQSLRRRLEIAAARPRPRPDGPIPIALVITDLDVGGAERALSSLALGLDRSRWTPTIVNLSAEGALVDPLRRAGLAVESLDLDRRRPAAGAWKLAKALRRIRPALVQSFLFHANLATKLAAPLAGRPWVVGGLRVAERRKGWHLTLDRLTQRLSCGSVCVSEGVRRFAGEQGGLDPARLAVIPNGVDPARFGRAEPLVRSSLGVPDDAFLFLAVGRLDEQKGLPDLLAAFDRAFGEGPAGRVRLAIAGDGPLRGWLDREVAARGGRVVALGFQPDVPGLMKAADALVHPAHWEGMPNAVLEAMAAGLPVAATRIEGAEDLVIPGLTGELVPPREPALLASALAAIAADPEAARAAGRAGRERIEAEFSPGRVVRLYDALWSAVLGFSS